jgi:hypothetical protein
VCTKDQHPNTRSHKSYFPNYIKYQERGSWHSEPRREQVRGPWCWLKALREADVKDSTAFLSVAKKLRLM